MIKPIGMLILAKKVEKPKTTTSGILLANTNEDEVEEYHIVDTGSLIALDEEINEIKENGKRIIVDEFESKKICYQNSEYIIIGKENILGIIS